MRIIRFMFAAMVATSALTSAVGATEVEPVEYIVSSQVVSDEASGVMSEGESSGNCSTGDCNCAPGSACAKGGLQGNLASAKSFIGDLRQGGFAGDITSGCVPRTYGYPDLFYNYYTQGNCNSTNAQMYLAPGPVPANVGHTFYTYQPFMPQEMLYWHTDRFHNYYDGGRGMNHTKVRYFAPPVRQAASNLYWNHIRIPR